MELLTLISQMVALGLPIAEDIIEGANVQMKLSGQGGPSADDQAKIDAAMDAAHQALQSADPGT